MQSGPPHVRAPVPAQSFAVHTCITCPSSVGVGVVGCQHVETEKSRAEHPLVRLVALLKLTVRAVGGAYTAGTGKWAPASRPVRAVGGVYTERRYDVMRKEGAQDGDSRLL